MPWKSHWMQPHTLSLYTTHSMICCRARIHNMVVLHIDPNRVSTQGCLIPSANWSISLPEDGSYGRNLPFLSQYSSVKCLIQYGQQYFHCRKVSAVMRWQWLGRQSLDSRQYLEKAVFLENKALASSNVYHNSGQPALGRWQSELCAIPSALVEIVYETKQK